MAALEIPAEIEAAIARDRARLARPGTWLTGPARVRLASVVRGEREPVTPAEHAARGIHDHPATLTREWLAGLESEGLTLAEYVEVLGVTARVRAIDSFLFGIGATTRDLPDPVAGDPSRDVVDDARPAGGWVPTVGPAWPPTVLSSVAAENEAMHDLHGALYLAPTAGEGYTMGNLHVERDGLSRIQMEYVAARTSLINDCFF